MHKYIYIYIYIYTFIYFIFMFYFFLPYNIFFLTLKLMSYSLKIFVILEYVRPNPNFFAHSVSHTFTHTHSLFCHSPDRVTDMNVNQPSICPSAALSVSLILILICFFVLNFSLRQDQSMDRAWTLLADWLRFNRPKRKRSPNICCFQREGCLAGENSSCR